MAETVREFRPRARRAGNALKPFPLPEVLQGMLDRGNAAIAQPFKGVTTNGEPVTGLFPIAKTGISLQSVVEAGQTFLDCLAPEQRQAARFDLENGPWRAWHNMHVFMLRHGALLHEMTEPQRNAALGLLRASLSAAGYEVARDVMRLNQHICEVTQRPGEYGEWYYWLSIMGTPSASEPWGWQIDGHHLIVNCFVLGDQIVLTPNFMGSEPVEAKSGKYQGVRVFAQEEASGYALMTALTAEQRAQATIGMKLPLDVWGTAFQDNIVMPHQGLHYGDMTAEQRERLLSLIGIYTGRIRPGHAEIRFAEVKRHLDETRFAWIGAVDDVSPFYYRIHNPAILIEFDHQPGIAYDNDDHSRNHIHTLVRTPNGNDYGTDLLRQHYRQFDHSRADSPHRLGKI
ncbi:MAG TPA: DUF3500 domain-containing protein [Stellaceae bacterium]|nr:DUF3500 domain-containing protein [Stellaceae bacterium]